MSVTMHRFAVRESARIRLDQGVAIAPPTDGPVWNKLLLAGTFYRSDFPDGKIELSRGDLETMVANWKAMGGQALRFDYHHRGSSQNDGIPREEKEASGWIEKLELRADGLWGLVKWTDEARTLIRADKYRYLSPEFAMNTMSRRTGKPQGPTLIAAGLLNDPFLTDLPRVAASDVDVPPANPTTPDEGTEHPTMKTLMSKLIHTLNDAGIKLASDALEPEVLAAFEAYVANVLKLNTEHAAAVKLSANVEPLGVKLAALESNVKALTEKNAVLEATAKKTAVDALINVLMNDPKAGGARITAPQQEVVRKFAETAGVEAATAFFMAGPVVLKLGEKGTAGTDAAVSAQDAYVKLQAAASDLVKGGCKADDALIRAMELNPALAKAAESLTSRS